MAKRLCYSGYKNPADVGSLSEFADTVFGNGYFTVQYVQAVEPVGLETER